MILVNEVTGLNESQVFLLNKYCQPLITAFGSCYLVGSSLTNPNFNDIDVRCIMPDDEFVRMFGENGDYTSPFPYSKNVRWLVICTTIASWLGSIFGPDLLDSRIDLDFQIHTESYDNKEWSNRLKYPLGLITTALIGEEMDFEKTLRYSLNSRQKFKVHK